MRLRPSLLVLPVLALALLASGCFEAKTAGTVSTPITVGVGTAEKEVNPAGSSSTPTTGSTSEPTTSGSTEATTGGGTTTGTSGGGNASFPASAKPTFAKTCGACHTLADAGTSGNVGPNLDDLKPDEATVANQIEHGGGGMPPGLLSGQDLKDVAAYVAAVAGKGGGGDEGTDTAVGGAP
jgi:cytochrome c553